MAEENRKLAYEYVSEIIDRDIAVIGVSARFPMAACPEEYWTNIENRVSCVSKLPGWRKEQLKRYFKLLGDKSDVACMEGAYLKDIDSFDHEFFHISPNEAKLMEPQQRILMELAYHTFEDAGYQIEQLADQNIAVYMGHIGDLDSYQYKEMIRQIDPTQQPTAFTGNLPTITSGRISNMFHLIGPNVAIDSACSSSLVAIALACQSLRNKSCDMAMVASVRLNLFPFDDVNHKIGIESSDYMTRSFDEYSDGSGIGEGAGALLLKPLWKAEMDHDNIYAVIKGFAVNQDGNTASLTAPNPLSQTEVLIKAWMDADIDPRTISYLEAHGTGTRLGDPIEIEAIKNAFLRYTEDKQFCAISSVKSNIGHLYDCSGMAGMIKAIYALKRGLLPPSIHFTRPNRNLDLCDSPLYINLQTRKWDVGGEIRRCGISSFGLSGTNCHLVLEEYKGHDRACPSPVKDEIKLLTLSAKTREALQIKLRQYAEFLKSNKVNTDDFLFTANTGRDTYEYRLAVLFQNTAQLLNRIKKLALTDGQELKEPFVFFGRAEGKKEEEPDRDKEAKLSLLQYVQSGYRDITAAAKLCECFIRGAVIPWHDLYAGKRVHKISLPLYPFRPNRFWAELPSYEDGHDMFAMQWRRADKPVLGELNLAESTVLLFGAMEELHHALSMKGSSVIQVLEGDAYQKSDETHYIISSDLRDYLELFEEIKDRGINLIIHGFTADRKDMLPDDIRTNMRRGVYSLFYIVKGILHSGLAGNIDIALITHTASQVTGREQQIYPENAALCGLGKVIGKEHSNLTCRLLDVDETTTASELILELACRRRDYQVAFRNQEKYFEYMENLDLATVKDDEIQIRKDGVYLITGGVGKIGLYMAEHLADKRVRHIVLLHRTPLPNRAEWDRLLEENKEERSCRIIRGIRAIEAKGVPVTCLQADVASREEMAAAMDHIHRECGKINGIIHAAGVPGKGLLMTKEREEFDRVVYPKTIGTHILDQLTRADRPDFMMLFSSGISTIGEVGQGDYTAANCFLDSFAYRRNREGLKTTTIDWVVWEKSRMMDGKSVIIDGIFKELPVAKALKAFDQILSKKLERVFVGEINYESGKRNEYLGDIPFDVPQQLRAVIDRKQVREESTFNFTLEGRGENSYTEQEQIVARLYKKILGYDKFNIYDSFFEMGGNSIQISQLYAELQNLYPGKIRISDLFQYTSIFKLAEYLSGEKGREKIPAPAQEKASRTDDIAIIGMAVHFPGAENLQMYWNNIVNGVECSRKLSGSRKQFLDNYLRTVGMDPAKAEYMVCSYIDHIDQFDYKFFQLSPREAKRMDPGQRLFLQTTWHALEDAGYSIEELSGSKTGVYLGYANIYKDSYQKMLYDISPDYFQGAVIGNLSAVIPSRIAYALNLKGPTMVVDTACSSSLVSVHLACNAIRSGDCDMALAGGMKLFILPIEDERFHMGIEAADGKSRSFDDKSDGSGMGEGVAVIVLKSLAKARADGDHIYAVIKGSAVNQDGSSQGITAPNPAAQTEVILEAWEKAQLNPETLAYYEAHATATPLGDPIEVEGLTQAFRKYTDLKQFCAIGSAKTVLGHLNECSGIAGLIKAVLIANKHELPPSLHFNKPNKNIDFYSSPVYVNTKRRKVDSKNIPLRCAVSSFGLSGTNCHMVIEEYVSNGETEQEKELRPLVFTVSAQTEEGHKELIKAYDRFFTEALSSETLEDICYTANVGRGHYKYRAALIVDSLEDLKAKIHRIHCQGIYKVIEPWFFYGFHKVNYLQAAGAANYNIHREELSHAKNRYSSLSDADLTDLCEQYISGRLPDWSVLFPDSQFRRVSLPGYPFDKTACWIPLDPPSVDVDSKLFYAMEWELREDTCQALEEEACLAAGIEEHGKKHLLFLTDGSARAKELLSLIEKEEPCTVLPRTDLQTGSIKDWETYDRVILACFNHEEEISSLKALEESQAKGVYCVYQLMQTLHRMRIEKPMNLVLVSEYVNEVTGREKVLKPQAASLFGLGKVLNKEFKNLQCRCIDIDEATSMSLLLKDLNRDGSSYHVAYRDGFRYGQVLKKAVMSEKQNRHIAIKENGVYIITGGTGDLGLEIAKDLSARTFVHIILLSRSLYRNEKDTKYQEARKIIESNGSRVRLYQTDITDYAAVKSALDRIRREFGGIHGVIHAAGSASTKGLTEKSEEEFRRVMEVKVKGAWIMDTLTREDMLDFFVLFSSTATICFTADQSDYVAANSFLDAYSSYRNRFRANTATIHWTTWKETGMAYRQNFNIDTIFKAIRTQDALAAFNAVLNKNVSEIIVGEINYESEMAQLLKKYPFDLSDEIRDSLMKLPVKSPEAPPEERPPAGEGNRSYGQMRDALKAICMECLEVTEISEHDNFFELGCDSILLKQIYSQFDQKYPDLLQIADFFEYSTISKLADYIAVAQPATEGQGSASDSDKKLKELLDRIEKEEDDISRMIDKLMDL